MNPSRSPRTAEGRTYLEVRTDVYKKHRSLREHIAMLLQSRGVADKVDWQKIDRLIKEESGVAEDVTLGTAAKTTALSPPAGRRSLPASSTTSRNLKKLIGEGNGRQRIRDRTKRQDPI